MQLRDSEVPTDARGQELLPLKFGLTAQPLTKGLRNCRVRCPYYFRFLYLNLSRGTSRNWSVLAFRFASLPSPPIPATAQTQTLAANALEKMKQIEAILTFLILTTGIAFGQEYSIADFVMTKPPKVNSKEWSELNYSRNEFKVSVINGAIKIYKADQDKDAILDIEGGQLIGTDHGEWGGKIEFIPEGGSDRKLIKEGNVKFVFKLNEIYFIEGLAHLSTNKGAMYRLENQGGAFVPIKVIEFEDAPEAMAISGNNLFIASHKSFFLIKDLKKETIFKDEFWTSLYPNSVAAIDDKNIYIGHRGGFTKLDILKKEIVFFRFSKKGG